MGAVGKGIAVAYLPEQTFALLGLERLASFNGRLAGHGGQQVIQAAAL